MGLLLADLGTSAELPGKQMCGVAGKTDVRGGGSACPDELHRLGRDTLGGGHQQAAWCEVEITFCPADLESPSLTRSVHSRNIKCHIRASASFTASGGTTSAFSRDTLGGGHQQPQIHSSGKRKWGQPEVGSLKGRCYYLKKRTAPVDCD
ncbi:hypothetical protein Bbelb_052800 [Branchiostoma belcheri]|nr:hypothetical protein Bbelb_052800 [Branchiostoma belcheri]